MAGRKPHSNIIKVITGNPGKRALNKSEPKAKRGIPPCPDWLSEKARSAWDEVSAILHDQLGVLTTADGMALQGLCEAHADWRAADDEIRSHGGALTYTTESGLIKAHPAVAMKSDADKRRRAWLAEFGLTPSARTKLAGFKDDKPQDPWDDF